MPQKRIAVDIGAGSGRVFAGWLEADGSLFCEEIHRFSTADMFLLDRRVLNVFRYYEEILQALRIFAAKHGPAASSIGVDSFSSDFTLLDSLGRPAILVRSYRDGNLVPMEPVIEREFGSYRLYRRNGNHSMPGDTLQQLLRMREEKEPALENPGGLLFVADLFHYLLGGRMANEHSMVSYSRLFDRENDVWDDEVFDTFGLPRGIRTAVARAGEVLGELRPDIARETGISPGMPIICPCTHDTSSAALCIPDSGDDWAFVSSGSWSLVGTETAEPVFLEKAWKNNFSNSTMPLLANMFKKCVTGMWLMQQCRKSWNNAPDAQLAALAEQCPDTPYFIEVDHRDFYSPPDMPAAVRAAVFRDYGVSLDPGDRGVVVRICLQSLAMKYRFCLDLLTEMTGKQFHKIYITGGGGKNSLLNQMTASVANIPVHTGIDEASVTGNLLLQMYGSGELPSRKAMREVVARSFPMHIAQPREAEFWNKKYDQYRSDMERARRSDR